MTINIPEHLISSIKDGRAVLFLGSGASLGAINPEDNKEMPTAEKLSNLLAEKFLNKNYIGKDLKTNYDLSCSQSSVQTVQEEVFKLLNPFQPAPFHLLVPTFSWHGIITTNYDLIIERAYNSIASSLQKIIPHVKDNDGATNKLDAKSILYIKLHGCISHFRETSPPLITSTEQLIQYKNNRIGQFNTFLEWAKNKTIIFCGYSFSDNNLRTLFHEIIKDGDNRPRHYLINKDLDEIQISYWKDRRIEAISSTFEEFMYSINTAIPEIQRTLTSVITSSHGVTSFNRFITVSGENESDNLKQYLQSFIEHIGPEKDFEDNDPTKFYMGFDLGWYPIAKALDVRQSIVDDIISAHIAVPEIHIRQTLTLIKGHAGSGKTVALRRLCWEAAKKYGRLCFYVSRKHSIQIECIKEIFDLSNFPLYIFIDNISFHRSDILPLISLAKAKSKELHIICTETYSIWNIACDDLEPLVTNLYEMRYLSKTNIYSLIEKLETHNCLGYLKDRKPEERIDDLEHRHGRQILVALLEATHGIPLENILSDEYRTIPSTRAQLLYLDICSLHRFGPPVRAGLISRIHNISFDKFESELFKPLEKIVVLRTDSRSGDYVYEARHSHIAHTVYENAIKSTEERFDNIIRIITKLNVSYSYDLDVVSKILKAENLENTLSDHGKIRQVYDVAENSLGNRTVLYHQRGVFELHVANTLGGLDKAEKHLLHALDIEPYNKAIKHSLAELDLKRSRLSEDPAQRRSWRQRSVDSANALARSGNSPYPHHTLLKAAIDAVKDALEAAEQDGNDEATTLALGTSIENAEKVLKRGLQAFPNEAILLSEEGELSNVLMNAVRAEKSFEMAFKSNPRSSLIAKRLSRIKRAKSAFPEARAVLQACLDHNPGNQDLHYNLAMTIIESSPDADQKEGSLALHHLRRSFAIGDRNRQAQFWYARQLCLHNNFQDARDIFRDLVNARIPYKEKKEIRGRILLSNGNPKIFSGIIIRLAGGSFVKCDELNLTAYFTINDFVDNSAEIIRVGDTIHFEIAFNLFGPVAQNIHT